MKVVQKCYSLFNGKNLKTMRFNLEYERDGQRRVLQEINDNRLIYFGYDKK